MLVEYWFDTQLEVSSEAPFISKKELEEIISKTLPMLPKEIVFDYISVNRSKEFNLKRKVTHQNIPITQQTAKPETKSEKVVLEERDYQPKQSNPKEKLGESFSSC